MSKWLLKKEYEHYNVMIRPKTFNWFSLIGLTIFLNIFGLIGYLIYYSCRKPFDEKMVNK